MAASDSSEEQPAVKAHWVTSGGTGKQLREKRSCGWGQKGSGVYFCSQEHSASFQELRVAEKLVAVS